MMRRPPRSTQSRSSAASDVYKRQVDNGEGACQHHVGGLLAGFLIVTIDDVVLAGVEGEVAVDDLLQLVQRCVERPHDVSLGPLARYVDDDEVAVRLVKFF